MSSWATQGILPSTTTSPAFTATDSVYGCMIGLPRMKEALTLMEKSPVGAAAGRVQSNPLRKIRSGAGVVDAAAEVLLCHAKRHHAANTDTELVKLVIRRSLEHGRRIHAVEEGDLDHRQGDRVEQNPE